jgi:hypothetical protein
MKRLLPLLGLLAATLALAAGTTANVAWTAPTAYTDGTAVGATDIASYTVTWTGSGASTSGSVKVIAPATTAAVTVPCGSATFTVTVTTSATAYIPNVTSSPTTGVPYATGVTCTINPPSALTAK